MAQLDGSPVVALLVPQRVLRQFLAMLQIGLGGIETECEILAGDVHLQFVPTLRIVDGAAKLAEGVHLVQLAGDIHVPGGDVTVKLPQQFTGGTVQAATLPARGGQQDGNRTGQTDGYLHAHSTKIGIIWNLQSRASGPRRQSSS